MSTRNQNDVSQQLVNRKFESLQDQELDSKFLRVSIPNIPAQLKKMSVQVVVPQVKDSRKGMFRNSKSREN